MEERAKEMTDPLTKEVQETAQRMADEVRAEMRKYALSPKKERAAFESWVIWHVAVLSVTLNRLCENVEVLESVISEQQKKGN